MLIVGSGYDWPLAIGGGLVAAVFVYWLVAKLKPDS